MTVLLLTSCMYMACRLISAEANSDSKAVLDWPTILESLADMLDKKKKFNQSILIQFDSDMSLLAMLFSFLSFPNSNDWNLLF